MPKLSLEYHNAKKNYKATKSSSRCAEGKENNKNRSEVRDAAAKQEKASDSPRPAFDPLVAKQPTSLNEQRKAKQRLPLPMDYNTAKLRYNASKSRAKSALLRESGESTNGKLKGTSGTSCASYSSRSDTFSNAITDDACNKPTPTAESGLKLLRLLRPIDNKTYEFGLSKGIELHLVESIKLCGLRKGREKSIIDMVHTLCHHLTKREDEINRWIEFADKVALSAAEKIEESMQEYQAIRSSRDEVQCAVDVAKKALSTIREEVMLLKVEINKARDGVSDLMTTFPPAIRDLGDRLRHQLKYHCDSVKSECKSEICDAIEDLTLVHDEEKQRFETVIGSLEVLIQDERDKVTSLQSKLNGAEAALEKEKSKHVALQKDLMAEVDRSCGDLLEAIEKIQTLEELLDKGKQEKKCELDEMEKKMKAELDDIDDKVKQSFKNLVEKKDKEVQKALKRAHAAEASAKAAERLLSELKASVAPIVSSVPSSCEKSPARPLQ